MTAESKSRGTLTRPLIFVIVAGFFAYLFRALWTAIFIVWLPMSEGAVEGEEQIQVGENDYEWRPTKFKDDFEELKYYHNKRMAERNSSWFKGSLVLGAGIGFLVFYGVPKIRGKIPQVGNEGSEAAICGIFLGVLVFLFVPAVYKWILPPPADWFPQGIVDISETRKLEALERLERVATSYSED